MLVDLVKNQLNIFESLLGANIGHFLLNVCFCHSLKFDQSVLIPVTLYIQNSTATKGFFMVSESIFNIITIVHNLLNSAYLVIISTSRKA